MASVPTEKATSTTAQDTLAKKSRDAGVISGGGEDVNAREDFVYADADAAINQPVFAFRFMLGINYRFGQ